MEKYKIHYIYNSRKMEEYPGTKLNKEIILVN